MAPRGSRGRRRAGRRRGARGAQSSSALELAAGRARSGGRRTAPGRPRGSSGITSRRATVGRDLDAVVGGDEVRGRGRCPAAVPAEVWTRPSLDVERVRVDVERREAARAAGRRRPSGWSRGGRRAGPPRRARTRRCRARRSVRRGRARCERAASARPTAVAPGPTSRGRRSCPRARVASSPYGVSRSKPGLRAHRRFPAATTRNSYQGSTMSLRSRPKTSHGIARSKVSAPWSMTAATGACPKASDSRLSDSRGSRQDARR